jgi:hypothetical protein
LKDCIIRAAEISGGGGEDGLLKYLVKQANDNPAGYLTLLGRIVPMQVGADPDSNQLVVFVNRYAQPDGSFVARDRDGNEVAVILACPSRSKPHPTARSWNG